MCKRSIANLNGFSWCKAGLALTIAFGTVTVLAGCKASEAKSTGFTNSKDMHPDPMLPFQEVWRKPGVDFQSYNKIYIADVNTEYMLRQTDWQNGERQAQIESDAKKLGVFTKQSIEDAFRNDPKHHFQVVSAPTTQPATLQLEMALTEVVPSKVLLNALGYAPFGIGMGLTAVRMVAHDQSSVAYEARLRDVSTGEIVAMAADREVEQFAPISVRGLTWYSHAETIIDQWSEQFVRVLNRAPDEAVKASDTITLKPW